MVFFKNEARQAAVKHKCTEACWGSCLGTAKPFIHWPVVSVPRYHEIQLCSPPPPPFYLLWKLSRSSGPSTAPIAPLTSSHLMWLAIALKSSKSCQVVPSRSALQWLCLVVSKQKRDLGWEGDCEISNGIHECISKSQAGGRDAFQAFLQFLFSCWIIELIVVSPTPLATVFSGEGGGSFGWDAY